MFTRRPHRTPHSFFLTLFPILFLGCPLLFTQKLFAKRVVTTLPELAWVAQKLDANLEVMSLLEGSEDPHFVDATPGFIFKVAKADLIIMNGMDLEVGWLPKVLQQSGNKKIQSPEGLCDASQKVDKIEVLTRSDRSMGDVHPAGNPHYTLSPKQMISVAQQVKTCFEQRFQKDYGPSYKKLLDQLTQLDSKFKGVFKDQQVYVFHREFNYLIQDYGLRIGASLEEVPGVLPSASYLARLAVQAQKDRPLRVLASNTAPDRVLEKFKEMTKVPYVKVRLHPKPNQEYADFITEVFTQLKK